MPSRLACIRTGIVTLFLCVWACSPASKEELRSRLIGTWEFRTNGMDWKWVFNLDGSLAWMIQGQTDMSGKQVDIGGDGSYSFDGAVLLLKLNKFAGLPGMWRSQAAAPGFDPRTEVAVKFPNIDEMDWSFSTEALGAQSFKVSRFK